MGFSYCLNNNYNAVSLELDTVQNIFPKFSWNSHPNVKLQVLVFFQFLCYIHQISISKMATHTYIPPRIPGQMNI